jgi:hypothetical protein
MVKWEGPGLGLRCDDGAGTLPNASRNMKTERLDIAK